MKKNLICPKCGSTKIAVIRYGMPSYSPELERDLTDGKVVLGGCLISGNDPRWHCTNCREEWVNRLED